MPGPGRGQPQAQPGSAAPGWPACTDPSHVRGPDRIISDASTTEQRPRATVASTVTVTAGAPGHGQ